jgi:hypothetical protein
MIEKMSPALAKMQIERLWIQILENRRLKSVLGSNAREPAPVIIPYLCSAFKKAAESIIQRSP